MTTADLIAQVRASIMTPYDPAWPPEREAGFRVQAVIWLGELCDRLERAEVEMAKVREANFWLDKPWRETAEQLRDEVERLRVELAKANTRIFKLELELAVALKLGQELANNPDRKLPSHIVIKDSK